MTRKKKHRIDDRPGHVVSQRQITSASWAHIHITGNLRQFTGDKTKFELPATSVKHHFKLLTDLYPDAASHQPEGMSVGSLGLPWFVLACPEDAIVGVSRL